MSGSPDRRIGTTRLVAVQADITAEIVDAVVNAANAQLRHGGGVAAAIASAGGPVVQEESDAWVREHGPVTPGTAAVTSAGDMPARHVVHTVGPVYGAEGDNAAQLRQAVEAALAAAAEAGSRSVALPAISAGIYGYPRDEATAVIVAAAAGWAARHPGRLDEVRFVGFDAGAAADFAAGIAALET